MADGHFQPPKKSCETSGVCQEGLVRLASYILLPTRTWAASRERHQAIQVCSLDISELLGIFNVFSGLATFQVKSPLGRKATAIQTNDHWTR